jgi:carbon-monoxide dehydrogenase medium subunit
VKPAPFAYHAPTGLDDALSVLAESTAAGRDTRVLAGGQSLVPMMNFRLATPDVLVDIGRLTELRFLRHAAGGELEIGAATRQSELLRDPTVAAQWPPLAEAARHIGHPQIRSRGTVGGSLVHHDPTAELPALAVALDARLTLVGQGGRRELAAEDFFVSYYEVALEPGEILLSVTFPAMTPETGWSFHELAPRRGDFALVGAVCVLDGQGGPGPGARLVLFGVDERPVRMAAIAGALDGDELSGDDLAAEVMDAVHPISDVHASAEFRRAAAAELSVRCLTEARARRR